MCGRYDLHDYSELTDNYSVPSDVELKPNYNVAPTHIMPVITEDGLKMMRWGLIPKWAKDEKIGYKLINTRSESVFDKPIWKSIITRNRCLIPANGFYEWQKRDGGKQPYYIHTKKDLMMFAGIWEIWRHDESEWMTYSILTTEPNKEMAKLHDRMPLILNEEDYTHWLAVDRKEDIETLLHPYHDNALKMFEVSKSVNSVKANDNTLILPVNSQ